MGRMHTVMASLTTSSAAERVGPSWLLRSLLETWSICKIAKKGLIPSQIGAILPDSHGIAQVKSVTGSKILRILKARGFAPDTPEGSTAWPVTTRRQRSSLQPGNRNCSDHQLRTKRIASNSGTASTLMA
ncbi:hypothetical protein OPV22_009275 [Ensete ventricosum]|uniref:Small ribosomal subunit protein uS15 N-terminal domain-containing protein n=1 Tax=Ensete ventricosum TaxID=4639 RepID=A0AAV8RFK4_ENSVE|nr:hypothetical protein OPV22_009275 [Ensete ventricosum]